MKIETIDIQGFDAAFEGMRNPLKSYGRADSYWSVNETETDEIFVIGPNDMKLAKGLWKGGTEHRKYLRMIQVWANIWAPRYWWSEYDTYRIGTSANSESTMHKILQEKFDESDFEWPRFEGADWDIEAEFRNYLDLLKTVRDRANQCEGQEKERMQQMLKSMLPESFIQKRTVNMNYETLATMYRQRKNHRLPQWREVFCSWVKTLPYSELITGEFDD